VSQDRKERYRWAVNEAVNKGNLDAMDKVFAADYLHHRPPYPDMQGVEAYKQFFADTRISYPDAHITIDELIIEGNTMAMRYTFTGTQTGTSPTTGAAPTGRQVTLTGCAIGRWEGDKVVESWEHADWLGLLQQLGVIPKPGQV